MGEAERLSGLGTSLLVKCAGETYEQAASSDAVASNERNPVDDNPAPAVSEQVPASSEAVVSKQ